MVRRLPDGSFAVPGLRGVWFLFRQWWVLGPTLLLTGTCVAVMIALARQNGRSLGEFAGLIALAPVIGFGAAMLTALPGFFLVRLIKAAPATFEPTSGEEVLLRERANHFLGDEGRGGHLVVTDRRVVFEPHRFNVQRATTELAIDRITGLAWGVIVAGRAGPLSKVMEVDVGGKVERFAIASAEQTAQLIDDRVTHSG